MGQLPPQRSNYPYETSIYSYGYFIYCSTTYLSRLDCKKSRRIHSAGSCSLDRETQHLGEILAARDRQQQPVQAQSHAGTIGKTMSQGRE